MDSPLVCLSAPAIEATAVGEKVHLDRHTDTADTDDTSATAPITAPSQAGRSECRCKMSSPTDPTWPDYHDDAHTSGTVDFLDPESERVLKTAAATIAGALGRQAARKFYAEFIASQGAS